MLKKILFPALSIFLIYQSIHLFAYLYERSDLRFPLQQNLVFAFLLNLFITGIFAFVGFAFPTSKIIPAPYYKIRNSNLLGRLYQILGVEYFKRFLLVLFWGKAKNKKRYFSGTRDGLEAFDYQTRQSEFGHLAAFLLIFIISVTLFSANNPELFIVTTLINIIANLYPVILQRMHRSQIVKLVKRHHENSAKKKAHERA